MSLSSKRQKLTRLLIDYGSVLIAFSGGVDSSYLLKVATGVLKRKELLAVTAVSETYPVHELALARRKARSFGARLTVITTHELENRHFRMNGARRCYFCKRELFTTLAQIARSRKLRVIIDASTVSDLSDYRPGSEAKRELGVRSPLQEAGFTKDDVRRASRLLGLAGWKDPSGACLASRVPYGTPIDTKTLRMITRAEAALRTRGFTQVRVRHYGVLCRIEVLEREMQKLVRLRKEVVRELRRVGYTYITMDVAGYRTGSTNEVLTKER